MSLWWVAILVIIAFFAGGCIGHNAATEAHEKDAADDKHEDIEEVRIDVLDVLQGQLRQLEMMGATYQSLDKTIISIQAVHKALVTLTDVLRPPAPPTEGKPELIN